MTPPSEPRVPRRPETLLAQILGPVAARLLAQHTLLLFEATGGHLVAANDKALFDLGLDLDVPLQPTFVEMAAGAEQMAEEIWQAALGGELINWSGPLTGAMDLQIRGALQAMTCGEGSSHVLVIHSPATAAASSKTPAGSGSTSETLAAVDATVGIIVYDIDGNIVSMNERAQSALEDYAEEMVGRNLDRVWPASYCESEEYFAFWEKLRAGRTVEGRFKHITAVESEVWFRCTFAPICDGDGRLRQVVQTVMDVTQDTYAAETAQMRATALWDTVPLCEYDPEGHVLTMNDAMAEALGYDADDCVGLQDQRFCDKEFARSLSYC